MRKLAFVAAMSMALSAPAFAVDGGLPVQAFSDLFVSAAQQSGSEVPITIGSCEADRKTSCVFEYGSVRVLVEGEKNLNGLANAVTIKKPLGATLSQLLETMEYTTNVIRPELSAYEARRFAYRSFENLIVTQGAAFTGSVDGYQVETSEDKGAVSVVITAPVF